MCFKGLKAAMGWITKESPTWVKVKVSWLTYLLESAVASRQPLGVK